MGLLRNIMCSKSRETILYAPISGKIFSLEELEDGVFSDKVLGEGCVIASEEEIMKAPFDGVVVMTTETKHAIGLRSADNVEVILHIGLDTVMMEGTGFDMLVSKGDKIKKGQPLIHFSKTEIKKAGYRDDVVVIVSNTKDFSDVVCTNNGSVRDMEPLLTITR